MAAWGQSLWRLVYVSGFPYHFPSKQERKVRGGDIVGGEAGSKFLFLLSRLSLDSQGGRRQGLRRQGATCVA